MGNRYAVYAVLLSGKNSHHGSSQYLNPLGILNTLLAVYVLWLKRKGFQSWFLEARQSRKYTSKSLLIVIIVFRYTTMSGNEHLTSSADER